MNHSQNTTPTKARAVPLHGCWQLISFHTEVQDSDERIQPLGANPNGYIIFTSDGRMMFLITAKTREPGDTDEKMAALFRTMMSNTGRYRIDKDRYITKMDATWNEAWTGSEQERFYKIDGDTLEVSTPWMPHPLVSGNPIARAILSFRRE